MTDKKAVLGVEPKLIRELAAILRDNGLTEIEIEQGGMRLRLAAGAGHAAPPPAHAIAHAPPIALPAPPPPPSAAAAEASAAAAAASHPGAVLSPMVGTAYLSPEPGAAVFVKVGDQVAEGQTLLIIEAMKTFNPIPAPRAGKLAQLLVTTGQPIEFGQVLAILE
jgi:acetyl-CoA carboxylase biotin carboxyl carrier protein